MKRFLIACGVSLLLLSQAWARDDAKTRLRSAEDLAKSGSAVEAAEAYAVAMVAAQKANDLEAQERLMRSLERSIPRALTRGSSTRSGLAPATSILMSGLSPKRNGAFLSCGALAHWCILEATGSDDRAQLDDACNAAIAAAKVSKSGAYTKAMASYARGLQHAAKQEHGLACPLLQTALDKMTKEGWASSAVVVATEAAAAYLAAGQVRKAIAALESGAAAMKASGDQEVVRIWRLAVSKRLPDAGPNVLAPYTQAMEPLGKGGVAFAKGGKGGQGGRGGQGGAGGAQESKVGKAWKKLSKSKPFISVKRTADGYVIKQGFDKRFKATQPYAEGVKHHDDGGVTLSFWDGGVRLYMVDLEGRRGQPGESSLPTSFAFFTPLAIGETWSVNKKGDITIKP